MTLYLQTMSSNLFLTVRCIVMSDYNFWADVLNKYSQFTPWVQVALGFATLAVALGLAHYIKEIVVALMRPFYGLETPPQEQWKDKYYRDLQE